MNPLIQILGRLHPMVLHLPIGLIAGVAAVESVAFLKRDPAWVGVGRFLSVLAAIAAVVAAATGYVLSISGDYNGDSIELHRNLGIAVAIASVLTAASYSYRTSPWPRRIALALCLACLLPAGHLGATITHGENFLLAPLTPTKGPRLNNARSTPADQGSILTEIPRDSTTEDPSVVTSQFETSIAPILASRCISCHGTTKQKGELALHTPDAIRKGGEFGPVLVPGNPKESELIRRMTLPMDDEEHMPPPTKTQPTVQEIATIESWIASGASFTAPAPAASTSEAPLGRPEPSTAPGPSAAEPTDSGAADGGVVASEPSPPPVAAIEAIRARLVYVAPVARTSPLLVLDTAAVAAQIDDDEARALLAPVSPNLADVSLARTKITDKSLVFFSGLPNLRRLDLRGTSITSAGLDSLKASRSLEELVLSQTSLSDEASATISAMASLKRVFLWKSGLSQGALDQLRSDRPTLVVDAGDRAVTTIAASESEVKLSGDAPPVGQPAAVSQTSELAPINAVCPVSGLPVVPKYSIVYNGKIVGFCCPNCPKEFWADPEKFEAKIR